MATYPLKLSLLFILLTTLPSISPITSTPTLGVTIHYQPPSATPENISATFNRHRIAVVQLIDPDPNLIRAFSYSSVLLLLTIPNNLVHSLTANRSNVAVWLYTHIALHELGIRRFSVSTTFSLITSAFPPSSAELGEPANDAIIWPFLAFLKEANSSFSVNHEIVLGYVLFQHTPYGFINDPTTGVWYPNTKVLPEMEVSSNMNIPAIRASGNGSNRVGFFQLAFPFLVALSLLMASGSNASSEVNPRKDVCIKCNNKEESSIILARGKYDKKCNKGSNKPYICSRCRSSRSSDLEVDTWGCITGCAKTYSSYCSLQEHVKSSHSDCKVCPVACGSVIKVDDTTHVCGSRYYKFKKVWYRRY